jgi:hypothetical protein
MPIIFDQVTGTVAPETPGAQESQAQEASPEPFVLERQVQQIQANVHRRRYRLAAE